MAEEHILDNFSDGDCVCVHGTLWQAFTDQVMDGRSEMEARVEREENTYFLRMRGAVSLDNNGGFIQTRLPVKKSISSLMLPLTGEF